MNKINPRLLALVVTSMLISGAAYAVEPQTAASAQPESPSASSNVMPHNHMRDAKGIGTGKKQCCSAKTHAGSAEATNESSSTPDEDHKQTEPKKKGVKPHSHPRDAK